jgi:hypothetical protein
VTDKLGDELGEVSLDVQAHELGDGVLTMRLISLIALFFQFGLLAVSPARADMFDGNELLDLCKQQPQILNGYVAGSVGQERVRYDLCRIGLNSGRAHSPR